MALLEKWLNDSMHISETHFANVEILSQCSAIVLPEIVYSYPTRVRNIFVLTWWNLLSTSTGFVKLSSVHQQPMVQVVKSINLTGWYHEHFTTEVVLLYTSFPHDAYGTIPCFVPGV